MSRKRRGFDIDLDAGADPETVPVLPVSDSLQSGLQRRGPMATAIVETAGALRDRAQVEAQIRSENDALAHEHVRLKKLGLITDLVPLDRIDSTKLTRDRAKGDDADLPELVASLREIGLSNPVRVEAGPHGRFELVQGYRRLQAFRALLAETGDVARYGAIPAAIVPQGETLDRLYRQMVDENLVRKDISFAEMAQMAVHYAADPGTTESDPDRVVALLFGSAGYTKRSYIRSFIRLIGILGADLKHAAHIPRALGLSLLQRLESDPGATGLIRSELGGWGSRTVQDELNLLRRYATDEKAPVGLVADTQSGQVPDRPRDRGPAMPPAGPEPARISFHLSGPQGLVRCSAGAGRIELRLDRDFSRIDRSTLEAAVQAMLDRLG